MGSGPGAFYANVWFLWFFWILPTFRALLLEPRTQAEPTQEPGPRGPTPQRRGREAQEAGPRGPGTRAQEPSAREGKTPGSIGDTTQNQRQMHETLAGSKKTKETKVSRRMGSGPGAFYANVWFLCFFVSCQGFVHLSLVLCGVSNRSRRLPSLRERERERELAPSLPLRSPRASLPLLWNRD